MHKLITALVTTLTILFAGSIVGKAEAAPRPMFPLTKNYTPTEEVAYYHRYARRPDRSARRVALMFCSDAASARQRKSVTFSSSRSATTSMNIEARSVRRTRALALQEEPSAGRLTGLEGSLIVPIS